MKRNIWIDGMMGVIVGDALGCPVQFMRREEIAGRPAGPVRGMESGGVYHMPEGTWTDDSSMALAALASIRELGEVDLEDIMTRFVAWYEEGEYTPFGETFDMGSTCSMAIENWEPLDVGHSGIRQRLLQKLFIRRWKIMWTALKQWSLLCTIRNMRRRTIKHFRRSLRIMHRGAYEDY